MAEDKKFINEIHIVEPDMVDLEFKKTLEDIKQKIIELFGIPPECLISHKRTTNEEYAD
jgi:hypothetical protein